MNYEPSIEQKLHNTDYSDYTLHFEPVLNSNGCVRFIDHSQGKELTVGINLDDKAFGYRVQAEFPALIADLVDLAVAIHASDRLAPHNLREKKRRLFVVLPVRHPELLSAEPFRTKLEDLLEWATGSEWVFDFQARVAPERFVNQQLVLSVIPQGCEVALWSGGLDALACLYTRLRMYPEKSFVLFGSGSNNSVYARQGRVGKKVESIFPGRCHLFRVPIRFHDSDAQHKNKRSRARGVVFTLLGAACAYLMNGRVLCVYENGIGAINLPYRASAVGLDHSRSVHPLTLLMVSDVVSELLGEEFRVQNPFLFWTKAKMCKTLAEEGRNDLPSLTMSCDSPHRQQQPIQCGYCSSCLLRRQALAANDLEDRTRYVVFHGERPPKESTLHLAHMLVQVNTLRNLLNVSDEMDLHWEALTREFPVLDDIVDRSAGAEGLLPADMRSHLIQLYRSYVAEWDTVRSQIAVDRSNQRGKQHLLNRHAVKAQ
jgi:Queuosine biosynthesis protein QueC